MTEPTEDKNLGDFFESVIHDTLERQILKLILSGKEPEEIIEELVKASDRQSMNLSRNNGTKHD